MSTSQVVYRLIPIRYQSSLQNSHFVEKTDYYFVQDNVRLYPFLKNTKAGVKLYTVYWYNNLK